MGKRGGPHGHTSLPHVLGGATYHLRQALSIQRTGVVGGGAVDFVHGVQRACAAPVAVSVNGACAGANGEIESERERVCVCVWPGGRGGKGWGR